MTTAKEAKLEALLARFLKPIKGIPFEVVIKSLCDVSVERFDTSNTANQKLMARLVKAMREVC